MKVSELKKLAKDVHSGKMKSLKPKDKFQFKCTACGKCCFNNEVMIGIYDLIRLRHATKLTTQELLKKKLINFYLGFSSGLPVLTINFAEITPKITKCPFLKPAIDFNDMAKKLRLKTKSKDEKKELIERYKKDPRQMHKDLKGVKIDRWLCGVYKDKPIICRLFPLGRLKECEKDSLKTFKEKFFLQKKTDWCLGWKTKHKYTLKSFLDECEFYHFKEGSDKSHEVLDLLLRSGFFASTKTNKKSKIKPLFEETSPVLIFLSNLFYNFDSINYFSKDKRVIKTIYEDSTHEDFMYVVERINKIVDFFIKSYQKARTQGNFNGLNQFMNSINPKGGEINEQKESKTN